MDKFSGNKILVVDDDPHVINRIVDILSDETSKYMFYQANDGNIAFKIAENKLAELQADLDPELRKIEAHGGQTFNASLKKAENGEKESYYYQWQIYEVAKIHDYYANLDRYKSWARLIIYTDKIFEIVFSIHGHGHGDNGIMVVTGFTFEKIPSEDTGTESTNTKPCSQEMFQFNYLESKDDTIKRFNEWIDDAITIALAEWQQTIT